MRNEIKLTKDNKDELTAIIKDYFDKERDEELGDLGASMFLDFLVKEVAPYFYNQGVKDSYHYLNDRIEDLLSLQK